VGGKPSINESIPLPSSNPNTLASDEEMKSMSTIVTQLAMNSMPIMHLLPFISAEEKSALSVKTLLPDTVGLDRAHLIFLPTGSNYVGPQNLLLELKASSVERSI
jgi:hypothetical protein